MKHCFGIHTERKIKKHLVTPWESAYHRAQLFAGRFLRRLRRIGIGTMEKGN